MALYYRSSKALSVFSGAQHLVAVSTSWINDKEIKMMRKCLFTLLLFISTSSAYAADHKMPIKGDDILTGSEIQTGNNINKGLVVVFLSAKCPCSDSHTVELLDLQKDFKDFEFIGIHSNADEELEFSKNYFEQKKLPFAVIQDRNTVIADQFKAFKTPHVFVLNSDGKVLYQGGVTNSAHFSRANKKFLREALEDIRAEKTIRTPEGRTLGCVIARSK